MSIGEIIFIIIISWWIPPYLISVILSPFYFKWGIGKWFYHDILHWHQPKKDEENFSDGLSEHNHCRHCGEEIMQDSQGNWFTY